MDIPISKNEKNNQRTPSKDIAKFTFCFSDSDNDQKSGEQEFNQSKNIKCESADKIGRKKRSLSRIQKSKQTICNPQEKQAKTENKQNDNQEDKEDYDEVIELQVSDVLANRRRHRSSIKKMANFFNNEIDSKHDKKQGQQKIEEVFQNNNNDDIDKNTPKRIKSKFKHSLMVFNQDQQQRNEKNKNTQQIFKGIKYLGEVEQDVLHNSVYSNSHAIFRQYEDEEPRGSQNLDDLVTNYEDNVINIFNPSENIEENSNKIIQSINTLKDQHNLKLYLTSPIPEGVVLQYQIHKYKYMTKTEYQLWLIVGDKMKLHAVASNTSLSFDKTTFDIQMSLDGQPVSKQRKVIAKLISDFKRQIYTCFDKWQDNKPKKNCNILCSIVQKPNYFGIQVQDMYIPKVHNKQFISITCTKVGKNLKSLYTVPQIKPQLERLRTHKIPEKQIARLKQNFTIRTNTTRNGLVKTLSQKNIFSIYKMQNNRFKLSVIAPVSPLQILCYGIVHLQ